MSNPELPHEQTLALADVAEAATIIKQATKRFKAAVQTAYATGLTRKMIAGATAGEYTAARIKAILTPAKLPDAFIGTEHDTKSGHTV